MQGKWYPVPAALALECTKRQWSKKNPAPGLVVHAVLWRYWEEGSDMTIREISRYAGCGRTRANNLRREARISFEKWGYKGSRDTKRATHVPPTCHPKGSSGASQSSDEPPASHPRDDRAREPIDTITNYIGGLRNLWDRTEEIRCSHQPGARRSKLPKAAADMLKQRLGEYGEDGILMVWRWWWTSNHHLAENLRRYDWETALRPKKFAKYHQAALEEGLGDEQAEPTTIDDHLATSLGAAKTHFEAFDVRTDAPGFFEEVHAYLRRNGVPDTTENFDTLSKALRCKSSQVSANALQPSSVESSQRAALTLLPSTSTTSK